MNENNSYHEQLKQLMDDFVNQVYDCALKFPKEEMYGVTSQLRRAALSVVLNYIEGFARNRKAVYKNFLEISYGSLQETKYLIYFSHRRKYLDDNNYNDLEKKCNRIGSMLWGIISKM